MKMKTFLHTYTYLDLNVVFKMFIEFFANLNYKPVIIILVDLV